MGIVHRDVKPDNIFLHYSQDGEAIKVIDFGIAKLMESTGSVEIKNLTVTGGIIGTPAYMSPERIQNQTYDGRSDVYSLGIMLYEMLCGRLPFESQAGSVWSIIEMHLRKKPQPPREVNPAIPEEVEALILQSLEKDPERRPALMELKQEFLKASRESLGLSSIDESESIDRSNAEEQEEMEKVFDSLFGSGPDQLATLLKKNGQEERPRSKSLSSDRWEKVREIFFSAIELEPKERASFLDRACAADADLRRRVEVLITADEEIHSPTSPISSE
jgi:serine/threonine protein kinase